MDPFVLVFCQYIKLQNLDTTSGLTDEFLSVCIDHPRLDRDEMSFNEPSTVRVGAARLGVRAIFKDGAYFSCGEIACTWLPDLRSQSDISLTTPVYFIAYCIQSIMLNLREKARASLSQYRNSPPSAQSEPATPVNGEDELSVLGGRSRLIASKEKSASPVIAELSPTTMNPIVPFPLKQEIDGQTHPMVLEYLRTFAAHSHAGSSHHHHAQQQVPPSASYERTTFSDMAPISTGFNPSTSFSGQSMATTSPLDQMAPQQLPSYFPVFDYSGFVGPENTFSQIVQMSPETEILGRSYSPGDNVQNTWQELVSQYGAPF